MIDLRNEMPDQKRKELFKRLKYTLFTAKYPEVDEILQTLIMKENVAELYHDFFSKTRVNNHGEIEYKGFFDSEIPSASLDYAMYNLLGWAPDSFLLKHQIKRVSITRGVGVSEEYSIPSGLFLLPQLESLQLSGMGLIHLPSLSANCSSLKYLDLSRNQISFIPPSFLRFSQLKSLNLEYNHLDQLPPLANRLLSLQKINLRGNQFQTFPASLQNLKKLNYINLSCNKIQEIPKSIREMKNLEHLHLAYNAMDGKEESSWSNLKEQEQFSLNF